MKFRGEVQAVEPQGATTVIVIRGHRHGAPSEEPGSSVGFEIPTRFAELYRVGRRVEVEIRLVEEKG